LFIFDDYHSIFDNNEENIHYFTDHPFFFALHFNRLFVTNFYIFKFKKNACFLFSGEPSSNSLNFIHNRNFKFIYFDELETEEFQNYLELINQRNLDIFANIQKNFSNIKMIEKFLNQNETGILEKFNQYKRIEYQQKIENFKTQISEQETIVFHREIFKFLFNLKLEMKVFSQTL
jgi:hypothetical protein